MNVAKGVWDVGGIVIKNMVIKGTVIKGMVMKEIENLRDLKLKTQSKLKTWAKILSIPS